MVIFECLLVVLTLLHLKNFDLLFFLFVVTSAAGGPVFTMGLFKRKDSKHSIHSDKDDPDSYSTHSRTSTASLKSPKIMSSNTLPAPIPEVPISQPPDPSLDPAAYLRSIHAVRERSRIVLQKARRNQLNHFDVDMSKFEATASYVASIIKVRRSLITVGQF